MDTENGNVLELGGFPLCFCHSSTLAIKIPYTVHLQQYNVHGSFQFEVKVAQNSYHVVLWGRFIPTFSPIFDNLWLICMFLYFWEWKPSPLTFTFSWMCSILNWPLIFSPLTNYIFGSLSPNKDILWNWELRLEGSIFQLNILYIYKYIYIYFYI